MPTNKNATLRYHALDRCFSNFGRRFYIEDLIEACNEALYEFSGIEEGIKKRQIFDDIRFMESEQGWSVPLDRVKDGKRVFYRYTDKSFSIKNKGITDTEAEQLKNTFAILSRFKGLPHFEWVEEMQVRLEDTFKLKNDISAIVGFDSNPFLKGLNYFTDIFNAIQNQQALRILYKGYRQEAVAEMDISPWYLKQYNNRWFLFGFNDNYKTLSNLALDRIIEIKESGVKFVVNEIIDFEEYFDDVVGVSFPNNSSVEKVVLKIDKQLWPYIESKPLHGSQKPPSVQDDKIVIELNVHINYEFCSLLFSFMDQIEVLEPSSLRKNFKEKYERVLRRYF